MPETATVPNEWPVPREVCRLEGHKNDVMLLMFSPDSKAIATGSKDGFLRVSTPSAALKHALGRRSAPHHAAWLAAGGLTALWWGLDAKAPRHEAM